jgi:D-alanyl-lipoteichoic acid acyltransferase DltB (MBOAT superfamily)
MALAFILTSIAITLLCTLANRRRGRTYLLMAVSVLAVYALQPALPIRFLDFWLPTATLTLAACGWALTLPAAGQDWKRDRAAALLLVGIALLIGLTRYLPVSLPLLPSRPPQMSLVGLGLVISALIVALLIRYGRQARLLPISAPIFILGMFIALKCPPVTRQVSLLLRALNHQAIATANPLDIRWLGFSYIAFRILHTLRDRQSGRLPTVSLAEYVTYVIFFPTLPAGPIDRLERFVVDLRRPAALTAADWIAAGQRIVLGLFKKFAIADSLALIALNATNAWQVHAAGWMWMLVYAYALQIYFDFSGYTDIAIGLGRLLGFHLPENFNAPYLKPNLTQFWNNWHMTLTQWFRAYFFNPLTRALRSAARPLPVPVMIFLAQISTMLLIGLWHGMTWNFILWGLWHGLGLFFHNRWSEWTRGRLAGLARPWQKALNFGGAVLTFHFVTLGWVFFALPAPSASWHVLLKLFGLA